MSQNIYDTPTFFAEYSQLPRSVHGLAGAPEWPTLRHMVGEISNQRILDLGCGFGWFCRWARSAGAAAVHGIDLSSNMLERAVASTNDSGITYQQANLETVELGNQLYELVYSSLALHYLPSIDGVFGRVFDALVPGGKFVFSIEHPVATAPVDPNWRWDGEGRVFWPLNCYVDEGVRVTDWLAQGVRKYHRTAETYLMSLIRVGFVLKAFRESWDGLEMKTVLQEKGEGHRPYFLLVAVQKPGDVK